MLRESLREIADGIIRSREERRTFLAKNRRNVDRLLQVAACERKSEIAQIAMAATEQAKWLKDFVRKNRKGVTRSLRELRQNRCSSASHAATMRQHDVARNKRTVKRSLNDAESERKRRFRQVHRDASQTIGNIKIGVQRIRSQSKRLTKSYHDDLLAARRMWSKIRERMSTPK